MDFFIICFANITGEIYILSQNIINRNRRMQLFFLQEFISYRSVPSHISLIFACNAKRRVVRPIQVRIKEQPFHRFQIQAKFHISIGLVTMFIVFFLFSVFNSHKFSLFAFPLVLLSVKIKHNKPKTNSSPLFCIKRLHRINSKRQILTSINLNP